ncbi:MAG: propionyl-CoA synthetase [Lewinella sp.]|jgi:acyl-coenzyme A synthetase/AMP-(fatty) acid ligase|uniref:propionyl-CoA synthetase n=1 Tax=Lewinella sp. TaxID=2004506 RepID=UPI003D6BBD51
MTYQKEYQNSLTDPITYWTEQAKALDWFSFPENILSQDEDELYRWYKGGKMNTSYLALDYHVANGRAEQTALIYDSPVTNTKEQYTYQELLDETARFAGVLKAQGVEKGDRVIIYMPMIPQVVFAMLACARLGAVHSVVFGGFAAHELAIRIDDAKPKLILVASGGKEIERIVPYKPIIDKALREATFQPQACIVYQRDFVKAALQEGRDFDWETLLAQAEPATYTPVDATDPLYILYTSGTTGQPKGIVRDNGGHAVALHYSMKNVYGVVPGDTYWAASDVGWVVGHSYIVYAPLVYGCTTVLFEGKPIKTPDAGTFWRVIEEYQVKVFFTAPTAFRAIKKEDAQGKLKEQYDTSCLKYLFLAGERTDINTLNWCEKMLQVPVIDHWWQTESGYPMLANMAGLELQPIKPGSAGPPVCGFEVAILDHDNQEVAIGEEGAVAIRYPLPPGCLPNLWEDTPRFKKSYLSAYPGYYFSGDGGYKDEEGYVFITGRIDDIINVAGHRLSTAEMEEVVAAHPAVAECAVIGVADELKGQIPVGFFVLKTGLSVTETTIEKELIKMVRDTIGPVAAFKRAIQVDRLPKTRSGKILRKTMRAIADKQTFKPPSTIDDMSVLGELEVLMNEKTIGNCGR